MRRRASAGILSQLNGIQRDPWTLVPLFNQRKDGELQLDGVWDAQKGRVIISRRNGVPGVGHGDVWDLKAGRHPWQEPPPEVLKAFDPFLAR